jgi:hypothetical protein
MLHSAKHNEHIKKVKGVMKGAGYKDGGHNEIKHVAKEIADKEVHKHEKKEHPGKPLTKLKEGGHAEGKKPHKNLGKYARGGAAKKKESHVHVNVVVPQGKTPMPVPVGQPPMGGGAPKPPMPMGNAPMGAPGASAMLPGGAPAPRMPGMKKGGSVSGEHVQAKYSNVPSHMTASSANGIGGLEKQKMYGDHFSKLSKRKSGGKATTPWDGTDVEHGDNNRARTKLNTKRSEHIKNLELD